ncbi:hypothetical protein M2271_000430 [Streptomyces sp. LBL]|uniref:hypothetical protein n=1 Tax=Streptomyces sp. LBL TaxID=2940562 RepID=UPI00247669DB|nr:hypothetical protein [Streptomyces sp. LBL]MDH6622643.1 hypothetical protein [Streptomyces sp. LBL]
MKRLCSIGGIARSSFSCWCRTAARQAAGGQLTAALRESGEPVNHKRIARVMLTTALAGLRLRRRPGTTVAAR